MPTDTLFAHNQGTGKSFSLVDESVVQLARKGCQSIIAVPHTRLALQHKEVIESLGGEAYMLRSFRKIWEFDPPRFVCPNDEDIAHLEDIGMPSQVAKKKYCKKCPYFDECPYPNQYKEVMEPHNKIVIIQHAHFQAAESMKYLMQKQFHSLFVDEDFTPNVFTQIKPSPEELKLFEWVTGNIEWMRGLLKWFYKGGYPLGTIEFNIYEMEWLCSKFEKAQVKWNLPEYIRAYNSGLYYDVDTDLDIFHPVPNVPNRFFTDATPPLDMLQIILNNKNIRVFGQDMVIDPKSFHPDNEVYQVLNASCSRYSMEKEGYYESILNAIGQKGITEHSDLKVLVTTFANQNKRTWDFFRTNFPALVPRMDINHLDVGSNDWEDFNVQWITCAPYLNAKDLAQEAYKLKTIQNFWHDATPHLTEYVDNPFPLGVTESSGYEKESIPLERITMENGKARLLSFPQFEQTVPKSYWYDLARRRMVGKKQQANRLRLKKGQVRILYDLDKQSTSNAVTQNMMIEDLFNEEVE